MKPCASALTAICILCPLLSIQISASTHKVSQDAAQSLELQKPVARELQAGESHSYSIQLLADQYVSVTIEQRGIDVMASLLSPDGTLLSQANKAKGPQGGETLIYIAGSEGNFKLQIAPAEKNSAPGGYGVTVDALRLPTADERALVNARQLMEKAAELKRKGKYDEALTIANQALTIREKVRGPEHLDVADSLHLIALLFDNKSDYDKAEPINVRALSIREKYVGLDHPDVAQTLFNLAWIYKVKQQFEKAESTYLRVLAIQEKALGQNHSEVATTLNDMAVLYNQTGRHDQSIQVNQRVLKIRENVLGPEDSGVAKALNNLARAYERKGDYSNAESNFKRAVTIWEKSLGPEHPEIANALDGLARIYVAKGDYAAAEPLFQRALGIREKSLGPDHPEVGTTLHNLAVLYRQKGDYGVAESLLKRDLEITEKKLGADHMFLAPTLNTLAGIYVIQGDYAKAEPLYKRALAIYEKALGPKHQDVGWTLTLLGQLYAADRKLRNDALAEKFFQRSLETLEKTLGPDHPRLATPLTGLAQLAALKKNWASAENLYQRALAIQEKALGSNHPDVAQSMYELSVLHRAQGNTELALSFLARSLAVREHHLQRNLPPGSERQKLEYLRLFADDTNHAVSLHSQLAPANQKALELAFTTVLRRKGRVLDVISDNVAALRRHAAPQDLVLFDQLADLRSQLATLTLRGPGSGNPTTYKTQLAFIEENLDQLEAEISKRSSEFRLQSQPITLENIQSEIPEGAVLVEFAKYRTDDEIVRYAAYVLPNKGSAHWVDLGLSLEIESTIDKWRSSLRDPRRRDVRHLARIVDKKVMEPVRAELGTAQHILISPDGLLNLIPFAALVDERQKYLAERYTITYLGSGRDLLRFHTTTGNNEPPVIVANPEFGEPALLAAESGAANRTNASSQIDYSQVFFGPLPGVNDEVRALRELLPDATVLLKEQATEAALRKLHGPRILHIATHGFFLEETIGNNRQGFASGGTDGVRLGKWAAAVDNPLLRSGLALAGANQGKSGNDDGVLTALEAEALDLWGTQLVVLSACDTGVGEVKVGDGVYGLRRALVLAGSDSQMMSLWPVSDRSTRDLMVGYYKLITKGFGRGESLRRVQVRLLNTRTHAHPYFWASFIQSGQWTSLNGSVK